MQPLVGADFAPDELARVGRRTGVDLCLGWVTGDALAAGVVGGYRPSLAVVITGLGTCSEGDEKPA
jgi:hypothetical protein